jgi:hypothetical protein
MAAAFAGVMHRAFPDRPVKKRVDDGARVRGGFKHALRLDTASCGRGRILRLQRCPRDKLRRLRGVQQVGERHSIPGVQRVKRHRCGSTQERLACVFVDGEHGAEDEVALAARCAAHHLKEILAIAH